MKTIDLRSMSVDQLWKLHEELTAELGRKIAVEKTKLDERLRKINFAGAAGSLNGNRRPYPKVLPKYRNPKNPSETWAGRGKQPRWMAAQLRTGKRLGDFLIRRSSA